MVTKHTSTPEEMTEFYSQFIQPGDLVFDIGAHIGQRTLVFLNMGANVVAVEPNPAVLERVDEHAEKVCAAVSDHIGVEQLWIDDEKTYMSTLSTEYGRISQMTHGQNYNRSEFVPTTTLDYLIHTYGVPKFIKIDVEGHEPEVIAGLHYPVDALSFEVHEFNTVQAYAIITLLDMIGDYDYSFSQRESMVMEKWPPDEIDLFGDVYAVRRET